MLCLKIPDLMSTNVMSNTTLLDYIVNIRELLDQAKTEMVITYWKALRKDAENRASREFLPLIIQ